MVIEADTNQGTGRKGSMDGKPVFRNQPVVGFLASTGIKVGNLPVCWRPHRRYGENIHCLWMILAPFDDNCPHHLAAITRYIQSKVSGMNSKLQTVPNNLNCNAFFKDFSYRRGVFTGSKVEAKVPASIIGSKAAKSSSTSVSSCRKCRVKATNNLGSSTPARFPSYIAVGNELF